MLVINSHNYTHIFNKNHIMMIRFIGICLLFIVGISSAIHAQPRPNALSLARHYVANQQIDSALVMYQIAYEEAPFDVKIYNEFLSHLKDQKKYKESEALIKRMMALRPEDMNMALDMVELLKLQGQDKQSKKLVDSLISVQYKKSSYYVHNLANALISRQMIDPAVHLYEKATEHSGNTQIYGKELMNLYLEQGHIDSVIPYFAEFLPYYPNLNEDLKSKILKLIDKDPQNKRKIEKALQAEIKKNNNYVSEYISLMNWLKQLDGQKEDALNELIKVNKSNPQAGIQEIMQIGQEALINKNFSLGQKAFTYLMSSKDAHTSLVGQKSLIKNYYYQMYHQKPVNTQVLDEALQLFEKYFNENEQRKKEIEYLWYADVIARFTKQPELAIQMIEKLLAQPQIPQQMVGTAKLLLGDFYLFAGQLWNANLTYAQVDKLFKQDKMGEEARYKQAKLAFYRGDFKWAQNQLNVLKASTTELISNDAMQLSILISENSFLDTMVTPLKMYAQADLLMYQQNYLEAQDVLKNIITTYPENDLNDDVYLLLGQIAMELGQFSDAVTYYKMIVEHYYNDVLADDALLRLAQVYHHHLNDHTLAQMYYEQLIVDFTNSSLVPLARAEYQILKNKK